MRNLISRHGLSKIEKAVSIARKPSKEGKRQLLQYSRHQAQYHATAVAAIVLSGRPKIDEPLNIAWSRALQHYRIKLGKWGEIDHQVRAAKRLFPAIIGENQIEARLTEIFRTAPFWLLQFTGIAMDARLLNFRVPDIIKAAVHLGERWVPRCSIVAVASRGHDDGRRPHSKYRRATSVACILPGHGGRHFR